jgi:DNA replication and repair protein RecF
MIDPEYKKLLSNTKLAIKHRNFLLKTDGNVNQIDAIDVNLASYSHFLTKKRDALIAEISPLLKDYFKNIFGDFELKIELISNFRKSVDEIYKTLKAGVKNDLASRVTIKGVHRDDYSIFMNNLLASNYSSVGQLKMAFLGLIFAFIRILDYKGDSNVVILIDDISGELDADRWNRLINFLMNGQFQIFITTANDSFFAQKLATIAGAMKLQVVDGNVLKL